MLRELTSLFGLSCIDEAMPGANEEERFAALADAIPLRAAIEKAPAPVLGQDRTPDIKPPEPSFDPSPGFAPPRR